MWVYLFFISFSHKILLKPGTFHRNQARAHAKGIPTAVVNAPPATSHPNSGAPDYQSRGGSPAAAFVTTAQIPARTNTRFGCVR